MVEQKKLRKFLNRSSSREPIIVERAMNGEEIAKAIGVTRQCVSNTLKRSMKKFYCKTKELDPEWSPFQVVTVMSQMFNITSAEDLKTFFNLFPPDVKMLIESDAKNYVRNV